MYIPMVSMLLLVTIVGAKKSLFEAIRAKGKGIGKAQDNQYDGSSSPSTQGVVSPSGDATVDLGVPPEKVDADAFKWMPELHKKDEAVAPGWSHDSIVYNQFLPNSFPLLILSCASLVHVGRLSFFRCHGIMIDKHSLGLA